MKNIDFLRIPLFSGLKRTDLAKLIPHLERMEFSTGEVICRQGEAGESMFIVVEGEVSVSINSERGGAVEIARLSRGEAFGEIALLTGAPRSATVQARTDITALRLLKTRFDALIAREPSIAVHLAGVLANRLYVSNVPDHEELGSREEVTETLLHSVHSVQAPSTLREHLASVTGLVFNKMLLGLGVVAAICTVSALFLRTTGLQTGQILLIELLLAATICWSLNLFNYHVVAIALPVLTVLFGITAPEKAFLGFASSSWFLVLGVLAITAALQKTGLMYRFLLIVVKRSPPSYFWKTFVVPLAGVFLTPVVPCPGSRAVMASPVLMDLSEILGFDKNSAGAVGLGMAFLVGFVNMSFLFLNGAADCLLALGLLPSSVSSQVSWTSWLSAALPMGLTVLVGSYLAVITLYRPTEDVKVNKQVIEAQLRTLGPITQHEKLSLLVIITSLVGFIAQPWLHIDGAWVAMLCFLILFATSVLNEKSISSDIDWVYVVSFGAAVSFAEVISSSGLTSVAIEVVNPYITFFVGNTLVFLLALSLLVTLIRFFLPLPATLVVIILSVTPLAYNLGINPFVIALVTLASANPWIFPYQNIFFCLMLEATDGKLFSHKQTRKMAFAHIVIVLAAVAISVPHWKALALIR